LDTRGQKNLNTAAKKVAKKRLNPVQESLSKNLRRPCLSSVAAALVLSDIYATHQLFYQYHICLLLIHNVSQKDKSALQM